MVAKGNGLRGEALGRSRPTGEAVRTWIRYWRRLLRRAARILRPFDTAILVVTHLPIMLLDNLSVHLLKQRFHGLPRVLKPRRGPAVAAIVLAPGLKQTTFSAYWMGRFLAGFFPFQILFLQTPKKGNISSFEHVVTHNRWIRAAAQGLPLFGVGFSKGGLDLVWLWHDFLSAGCTTLTGLFTISTPFRGTAVARLFKAVGAKAMRPGSLELKKTRELLEEVRQQGVFVRFFCALLDRICRRSDARTEREGEFQVPSKLAQMRDWLVWIFSGLRRESSRPWWWATTLPHLGHTALYNPLVWLIVGVLIRRQVLEEARTRTPASVPLTLTDAPSSSRCA